MSKYVKELQIDYYRRTWDGVTGVVVIDTIGMPAFTNNQLRLELAKKAISLEVVKNSLAKRVLGEFGLGSVGSLLEGPTTVAWGGESIVELAKEITAWAKKLDKHLKVKGACVEGQLVAAAGVDALSKMPSKEELIGRVIMLAKSPAARLMSLAKGPAARLVSALQNHGKSDDDEVPAAEGA